MTAVIYALWPIWLFTLLTFACTFYTMRTKKYTNINVSFQLRKNFDNCVPKTRAILVVDIVHVLPSLGPKGNFRPYFVLIAQLRIAATALFSCVNSCRGIGSHPCTTSIFHLFYLFAHIFSMHWIYPVYTVFCLSCMSILTRITLRHSWWQKKSK